MATCETCKANKVCDHNKYGFENCNNYISADVVEVVRCKDCGMFVDNKEALVTYCKRECKNLTVNPSDFCSYGERKDT